MSQSAANLRGGAYFDISKRDAIKEIEHGLMKLIIISADGIIILSTVYASQKSFYST